jgi:hypothetical protein
MADGERQKAEPRESNKVDGLLVTRHKSQVGSPRLEGAI